RCWIHASPMANVTLDLSNARADTASGRLLGRLPASCGLKHPLVVTVRRCALLQPGLPRSARGQKSRSSAAVAQKNSRPLSEGKRYFIEITGDSAFDPMLTSPPTEFVDVSKKQSRTAAASIDFRHSLC